MMAEGWTMGLNAGSSVPEGGCSLTFMTLGTADWKTMFRMGWGAVLSIETTTTSTSERPGSGSRAKWKRTRKPCWSYTVTGKMLLGLIDSRGTVMLVKESSVGVA